MKWLLPTMGEWMVYLGARRYGWMTRLALLMVALSAPPGFASEEGEPVEEEAGSHANLERRIEELEEQVREAGMAPLLQTPRRGLLPPIRLGGYANVNYLYRDEVGRGQGGDENHFALGEFDLFFVSKLSDRFSALAELVFEFDSDGTTVVDVERLLIKYDHRDWLSVAAGRGHTPVGYWNRAYHHGTYLWTTIDRPVIFEFEDEGGILPMHFVGLEASGTYDMGHSLIGYSGTVSNGRGRSTDSIQLTDDLNKSKMVIFSPYWRPSALSGFEVGGNILWDDIPADPDATPARDEDLDEIIAGGYVIYQGTSLEFFLEGQYVRHQHHGTNYESGGGYVQAAYAFGAFKPYYRFDLQEVDSEDPFYLDDPEARDTREHTVGLRFDWTSFLVLKAEYRRRDADGNHANIIATQVAVRF